MEDKLIIEMPRVGINRNGFVSVNLGVIEHAKIKRVSELTGLSVQHLISKCVDYAVDRIEIKEI